MLFNSFEYLLVFLPTAAAIFFTLNRFASPTAAKSWLVVASLAFYSWWGIAYLPLILISILINYGVGTALGSANRRLHIRKGLLAVGIGFNLALLGYFKYANFFVDNLNDIAGSDFHLNRIVLPLAISFFTFQQIMFLVDTARGGGIRTALLPYGAFVTFFPHLIAGPIVRPGEVIPQLTAPGMIRPNSQNLADGGWAVTIRNRRRSGPSKPTLLASRIETAE